jgi:hypothetical protein
MSLLAWNFRQLVAFWLAALACSVALVMLGGWLRPRPEKFFWILPARSLPHGIWLAAVAFFRARPIEAIALVALPVLTAGITLAWLTGRLVRG